MKAVVLMATACTKSLGVESGGHVEKWIARKHYQVLASPQPMTTMTKRKSQGLGCDISTTCTFMRERDVGLY